MSDLFLEAGGQVTWRDAEARLFAVMLDLIGGHLQSIDALCEPDRRRLGYLVELVAFRIRPANRDVLIDYARQIAGTLDLVDAPTITAVPGARPAPLPGLDVIAEKWRISPGLDIARFKSEARVRS